MNLPYYLRKKIIDWLIHLVMVIMLVVTLFPICWMMYCSVKDNLDILIGKIPLSHAHNDVYDIAGEGKTLWVLTSDGGINKWDLKTMKEQAHVSVQTQTTNFLLTKDYIWVSSANKGLIRVQKDNIRKSKEFKLPLPDYDRAKVVGTSLVEGWGKMSIFPCNTTAMKV